MHLQKLSLTNFKNYGQFSSTFGTGIHLVAGQNGTGKTNLLDAIHYLCFCKSYFHATDMQQVRHGESFFRIEGSFELHGETTDIVIKFGAQRKKEMSRNDVPYEKLSAHIGLFPAVMIAPDDIMTVKGSGEERRKLIDLSLAQQEPDYLQALILCAKLIQQRNALLKQFAEQQWFDMALLETYNQQLIEPTKLIWKHRCDLATQIVPKLQLYYEQLSGGREQVSCVYQSALHETSYEDLLQQSLSSDRRRLFTTEGIHRDEWAFGMGRFALRKFGSQGQQKTFLIALKLALFAHTAANKQLRPLLLLDDIFDKLDEKRIEQLISLVAQHPFGQVFITDTQQSRLQLIFEKQHIPYQLISIVQ